MRQDTAFHDENTFQYIEPLDEAGRTPQQIKDMQRNAMVLPELTDRDKAIAAHIGVKYARYPKAMYLSVEHEIDPETKEVLFPKGDLVSPNYCVFQEHTKRGRTVQFFARHPFKSISVKDEKEEKAARAKGAVDTPDELPKPWLS